MTNYYLIAKKVHRFLVLIVTSLALIMVSTGALLKNSPMARYIHHQISPWLAVTLLLMAASGLVMYFYFSFKKKSN